MQPPFHGRPGSPRVAVAGPAAAYIPNFFSR
jgi:hypothetical protein